ncbi:MAG: lysine--tRNA ligase [Candidatus Neomarinimicrobiota bacterium]|jgi:lysyl-tRNA synthetase class 2|nr:lysine--tRNA ligase [Candidatus Neomarinimicrobiota bacterium]MEC8705958.1 lysine--tRNA ligase [Candidatus Neomarinimicrobiota bacterium]|tara:strand:+ start:1059 stop:2549 length:1491 start_codon:yes stop_codon:yes gene_type:complete
MSDEQKSLNQLIQVRKEKLEKIIAKGIDPYPSMFNPTHSSKEVLSKFNELENKSVIIAGRILSIRKMGKASFFHIQDSLGKIQIFIKKDDIGEDGYENFMLMDIGDFVGVEGPVFKTKVGEVSIKTASLTILCKAIRPLPIVKEKEDEVYDAFNSKEQRYRNRHLDLIVNTEVRNTFVKRSKIIKEIRSYLDKMDFLEVETPVLQPIYGGANARPFTTHHNALDQRFYLRIADELYLKRLVIGGIERVYEIAKDFRNEGMDRNHNPEFTMLEFYWAYADYVDNMNLVEDMIRKVSKKTDSDLITYDNEEIDLNKPFKRVPFFDLLNENLGEDISQMSSQSLKELCNKKGLNTETNNNYGQFLDQLMSEFVEPKLIQPTFVTDYPTAISPLAKKHRNGNEKLVERFELFIAGSEFANAFSELNDPIDQRERFESQQKLALDGDEEAHPVDENFLQAMESGMPPTGGVGIGIDRLVMLLTGNRSIKDVILFPAMKNES